MMVVPDCVPFPALTGDEWGVPEGMILEDDLKDEHLVIVWATVTGEFEED
jgi:hypothetical protein